jgi:hypothetical protein
MHVAARAAGQGSLTGRPGTAAIVAGAINRIVAAPNTSSEAPAEEAALEKSPAAACQ